MKRICCLLFAACVAIVMCAQTQQGYVKTKGRLGNKGAVVKGSRLSGATVTVRGGNAVVSGNNGSFSLVVSGTNYYLQNVQKQGYVLSDPDVLSKQYVYSKNPLVLVMETEGQQADDKLQAERKIRRTLQRQLQQREAEIERLKEQNKIKEDDYRKQLQQLYADQENNERLIGEMADRYARIDYDQLDDFNRRISEYILNGELKMADSLLKTKGNINSRTDDLRQLQEYNEKEEAELAKRSRRLEKSKALAQKALEDIAQDCYSQYEIFKMQYANDSAAYYIALRASLDTMNVAWQTDAGNFYYFLADYDQAQAFFERVSRQVAGSPVQESACLCKLANVSIDKGQFQQAMEYHQKALKIREDMPGDNTLLQAENYFGLGNVYHKLGDYPKAMEYFQKTLEITEAYHGEPASIGNTNNALGAVLLEQGKELDRALRYLQTAYDILKTVNGEYNVETIMVYSNMGNAYRRQQKYSEAIEVYQHVSDILHEMFGERHHRIGRNYLNIGVTYVDMKNFAEAEKYLLKSAEVLSNVLGPMHPDVGNAYTNLASCYGNWGKYEPSLVYYQKALPIYEQLLGPNHHYIGLLYLGMGATYYALGQYANALETLEKALPILENVLGDEHPYVSGTKKDIEELKSKLK